MSIIVHQPQSGAAKQLFLLFHGVGATPDDLVPLGQRLAQQFPHSAVVSVQAAHDCPYSNGFQWFSLDGITEELRPQRVAQALPLFRQAVQHWQTVFQVSPEATALVGFSQGAGMALTSTQQLPSLAARIVSLSGRFTQLPDLAPEGCTMHLIHGKQDAMIPYAHTVLAAERLVKLGADVTADVIPFVGHEITEEIVELVMERLTTHVPKRYWEAAQNESAPPAS
ncbi:esterase [Variovorax sp. PCZ-1]|uniref:esterase n=1 Tax=Variovorax sp. PCZ-1 TaxID=2835533 RepID=UPI001BD08130|nr:esterase [Variovorax sp. PCZ-1]MBS7809216.1 esterase [Variovorax sp. PCZ-1]